MTKERPKTEDQIKSRLRTASVSLSEDIERKLNASLRAADIFRGQELTAADQKVLDLILDKYVGQAKSAAEVCACPRCNAMMTPVRLATRKGGQYCTACRVVTPVV